MSGHLSVTKYLTFANGSKITAPAKVLKKDVLARIFYNRQQRSNVLRQYPHIPNNHKNSIGYDIIYEIISTHNQ